MFPNNDTPRSMTLIPIFISLLLILGLAIPSTAYGALYASLKYVKSYNYYYLWVPAKVDVKYLLMMLDTGAWMSFITSTDVHKLGLDMLPQSKMVGLIRQHTHAMARRRY